MARSVSTSLIKLKHICWRDDSLIITLPQHKGDKTGKNTYGRHLYANPLQPEICPITALAVLIFSKQHHYAGGRQDLFEGSNQEKRYAQILSSVINSLDADETALLGANKEDIGTHSTRKGAPFLIKSVAIYWSTSTWRVLFH